MRQAQRMTTLLPTIFLLINLGISFGPLSAMRAQAAPDVGFRQVEGPPFDAPDVWVDSPLNGYGTYLAEMGSDRAPALSGDPLWPGRVHRVYARVHNFGSRTASNLTVRFYVRQPAGISDDGFWPLVGTLQRFGPIQANSFRDGYVEWTPMSDVLTSIKVEVDPARGETSTANNVVLDNSSMVASSPLGTELDFVLHLTTVVVRDAHRQWGWNGEAAPQSGAG